MDLFGACLGALICGSLTECIISRTVLQYKFIQKLNKSSQCLQPLHTWLPYQSQADNRPSNVCRTMLDDTRENKYVDLYV